MLLEVLVFTSAVAFLILLYLIRSIQNIKQRPPTKFTPEWYLSDLANRLELNAIRKVMRPFFAAPKGTVVQFAGGRPNNNVFPFESISVQTNRGFSYDVDGDDLNIALQYGPSKGLKQLNEWIQNLIREKDGDFSSEFETCVSAGSNFLIVEILDIIYNPGDVIVVQNPVYPALVLWSKMRQVKLTPLLSTHDGLDVEALKAICERTPVKMLYCVPNGGNPSGVTMSESCRRAIYALSQRYNFLILEDDPYRYCTTSVLPESFLGMDFKSSTPGRVLRCDSFSKILAPGLRLGWVTGHKTFIEKISLSIATGIISCSYLDMMLVYKFLTSCPDFGAYLNSVAVHYETSKCAMVAQLEKHFKPLGAKWSDPKAGFFIWLDLTDTSFAGNTMLMVEDMVKHGVVCVPGNGFSVTGTGFEKMVRLSFSEPTVEQINRGIPLLKEFFFPSKKLA